MKLCYKIERFVFHFRLRILKNLKLLCLQEPMQITSDLSYLIFNPDNLENKLSLSAVCSKDVLLPISKNFIL